jgi:hypothetical protein
LTGEAGTGIVEIRTRELGPGLNAERTKDAGEMRLDGMNAHEERVGDFLVRMSERGELGDTPLGIGQGGARGPTRSDTLDLGPRTINPVRRPKSREVRQSRLERGARRPALSRPTPYLAKGEPSAS